MVSPWMATEETGPEWPVSVCIHFHFLHKYFFIIPLKGIFKLRDFFFGATSGYGDLSTEKEPQGGERKQTDTKDTHKAEKQRRARVRLTTRPRQLRDGPLDQAVPKSDLPLQHAKLREYKKDVKYKARIEAKGEAFHPLIIESTGAFGLRASPFFQILHSGAKAREHKDPSALIASCMEEAACIRASAFADRALRVAEACQSRGTPLDDDVEDFDAVTRCALSDAADGQEGGLGRVCPCGFVNQLPCDVLEQGMVNPASDLCFVEGTQ